MCTIPLTIKQAPTRVVFPVFPCVPRSFCSLLISAFKVLAKETVNICNYTLTHTHLFSVSRASTFLLRWWFSPTYCLHLYKGRGRKYIGTRGGVVSTYIGNNNNAQGAVITGTHTDTTHSTYLSSNRERCSFFLFLLSWAAIWRDIKLKGFLS